MNIQLNGNKREIPPDTTITMLLHKLNLTPASVVIELNKTILQSEKEMAGCLKEGDKLELIHFVGGG